MVTFDSVIKKAYEVYLTRDNYCYLMGGKGQVVTDALIDNLMKWYPEHYSRYSEAEIKKIKNYSRGKIAFDCSGFTAFLHGDNTYSGQQITNCKLNPSLAEGVAGSLLWKPGHVGIDVGYGLFMHFPIELHTCELGWIRDYNWEKSGLHKNIDYTGSTNK